MCGVLVVVALLTTSVSDSIYDQIQSKTRQLNGVNSAILGTKTRIGILLAQQQSLQKQISTLDGQLAKVAAQIKQENARLRQLAAQITAAKAQLAEKEAALSRHIADMGSRMRSMYKTGQVSPIELVFSAANFTDLLNRIFFFNDVVRAERQEMDELEAERRVITGIKADLDTKYDQQKEILSKIKAQQAQLKADRADRAAAKAKLAAIMAEFQQRLQEMQAQRAQLNAELGTLLAESARAGSTGRFIWPMNGYITQGFGCTPYVFEMYDPSCPSRHFHSGIDIAAYWGTPVHASDGGIVHNYSMWCGGYLCGYGHYVVIVHSNGYTSLYGHLSGYAVGDGTQVGQGAVIGYEGSTGNSTGPHLHFEIDHGGNPVNPLAYLP
jgi:murein DD-endopeptidase MepM/ murein hydrolase activator NlpD